MPELKVKDLMVKEVTLVEPEMTIDQVAKEMRKLRAVCAVVTEKKKPIGIITESDIIKKVVAKNKLPKEVKARQIMSTPILTTNPEQEITSVARLMRDKYVRQLPVIQAGKIKGIIHSRDITKAYPGIIEVLKERLKMLTSRGVPEYEQGLFSGYCEKCGMWSDDLIELEGKMVCGECRG